MSSTTQSWQAEFGVEDRTPPSFFADGSQISGSTPQGHLLRRAFDTLDLDGALCVYGTPLVYFKVDEKIQAGQIQSLHRQFWNHGGATVLVIVGADEVHIYSGSVRPSPDDESKPVALVEKLKRVASELQAFLVSVESGAYFHTHRKSFNPGQRVDQHLLRNLKHTRDRLSEIAKRRVSPEALDSLLCRLVFTCYLFDRKVIGKEYLAGIGIPEASALQDVLKLSPPTAAKEALYSLFDQLGEDFNGDLFSDDLSAEKKLISVDHLKVLRSFFDGTDVQSGQQTFWPYDFGIIPIETISAIYERFLTPAEKAKGAFYTPRFLAEVVIDMALQKTEKVTGQRFLDPACGSGIFLVGLFNRLAEEWKQENPRARNDRKARELMKLLQGSLFGADSSPTACRIAAFSLYLAYLDQLTPPDIQALQQKGHALPRLVKKNSHDPEGNIWDCDFFDESVELPHNVDFIIGNPPWGSIATRGTPAGDWCASNGRDIPDNQIAAAFIWKSSKHISESGRICFLVPHGLLFNHSGKAIQFQRAWVESHKIEQVMNLADLRFLLFEDAKHPALIIRFRKNPPETTHDKIEYLSPKADWAVTQAEVISVSSDGRCRISVGEVLQNLKSDDAPQIWKQYVWATERDRRLIDRLTSLPRLRNIIRQIRERESEKPWLIAEGFQPLGENDDPTKATTLELPSSTFVSASEKSIDLLLLPEDCEDLGGEIVEVRSRSNKHTGIYRAPHVLVTKGFKRIAFADFDVSFRHALRGIAGPPEHADILAFLAAYLRSPLARYYQFHTSSNWGIYRPEVHVDELIGAPFMLPEHHSDPKRAKKIVRRVRTLLDNVAKKIQENYLARASAVETATKEIEPLIFEYFDVLPNEAVLIKDTLNVLAPSIQPTHHKMPVPTVKPALAADFTAYEEKLCGMLNQWGRSSGNKVSSRILRSEKLGVAVAIVCMSGNDSRQSDDADLLPVMERIRQLVAEKSPSIEIFKNLLVFDGGSLYLLKPIGKRFWTQTAALNDADEIASSILMHGEEGR